jgi:hypothetical protein
VAAALVMEPVTLVLVVVVRVAIELQQEQLAAVDQQKQLYRLLLELRMASKLAQAVMAAFLVLMAA